MKKKVIICVDDEKIVLDSLIREISYSISNEYTIEVAEGGEEAIELFDELLEDGYEIPLVISDYIMPDIKGDVVLESIKIKSPQTYTILLTGQATIEGVVNAINKADLYRYMSKPWESTDLGLTIKESLKSYEKDQQLLKLDSAKSYFLGLLSHELNTPLIGINGNAKLIYEITDDPDIKESAESILTSESRLRKFADLSLLITRIQTDKYRTNFYEERLLDIIDTSLFNFDTKLKEKGINVVKKIDFNDFNINVDVSLIGKVFDFVLDNAIKFSPENSQIVITGTDTVSNAKIEIQDNGCGFSPNKLKSLFQLFASSEDLMSHSEGTGLSLAAAKVIMDFHSFEINAYNNENGGAVVSYIFKK